MMYYNDYFDYVKTLDQCIGCTLTADQLIKIIGNVPLIKFMNDDDKHYNMIYKTGYNKDILLFNNTGSCSAGGIYITSLDYYYKYAHRYGKYARRVKFTPKTLIYIEDDKLKCNEIILEERELKDELLTKLFNEYIRIEPIAAKKYLPKIINNEPYTLEYIDKENRTHEMIMTALGTNGYTLKLINVEDRTYSMMLEAMKGTGYAITLIDEKYKDQKIITAALKNNGFVLKMFEHKNITHDMRLIAVGQNGLVLRIIDPKDRTLKIILAAIYQTCYALAYVDKNDRTDEMIKLAEKQNRKILKLINN